MIKKMSFYWSSHGTSGNSQNWRTKSSNVLGRSSLHFSSQLDSVSVPQQTKKQTKSSSKTASVSKWESLKNWVSRGIIAFLAALGIKRFKDLKAQNSSISKNRSLTGRTQTPERIPGSGNWPIHLPKPVQSMNQEEAHLLWCDLRDVVQSQSQRAFYDWGTIAKAYSKYNSDITKLAPRLRTMQKQMLADYEKHGLKLFNEYLDILDPSSLGEGSYADEEDKMTSLLIHLITKKEPPKNSDNWPININKPIRELDDHEIELYFNELEQAIKAKSPTLRHDWEEVMLGSYSREFTHIENIPKRTRAVQEQVLKDYEQRGIWFFEQMLKLL